MTATKMNPSKSPKAAGKKVKEIQLSPKRSDTVEGLLERVITEQPVSYEDVFKTRNRVIDDRTTPVNSPAKSNIPLPPGNDERRQKPLKSNILEEVDGFLNSLYQQRGDLSSSTGTSKITEPDISKYSFSNQKSNGVYKEIIKTPSAKEDRSRSVSPSKGSVAKKFVAWDAKSDTRSDSVKSKILNKELSAFQTESIRNDEKTIDESEDFVQMLKSSSQILILPEVEAKYLNQYHLDSSLLNNISVKVETLSKKMKEITRFIKSKIKEEEAIITPSVVKIQAWYRGWRCRKYLIAANLPIYNRSRYFPDLQKANQAAIKIQSIWRGVYTRAKLGPDFKISILKAIVKSQAQELKRTKKNYEKDINDIKRILHSLMASSMNIPTDEISKEPSAS